MPGILSFVCLILVLWKACCLYLRAKRFRYIASLSPREDALLLYKLTNYVEFGFLCHKALEFALFRTFAIPSISKLLHSSRQFCPSNILKRYDDTDILTQEFVLNHVDSRRGSLAIRRLNFIHAQYNIPNADLLYTLSLFVLEPIRFAEKFGYRNWTEGEKQAQFVVWHDIGKRMGIRHIPESLEEMERFSWQYEAMNVEYSESNRAIGDATLDLLLSKAPAPFRPFARRVAYALFDERLVKAMGYSPQPYWFVWSVEGIIRLFGGTFVRWCLPPRPIGWSTERITLLETEEGEDEEVYKLRYDEYKPSIYPNGYKIEDVGNAPGGRMGKAGQGSLLCPLACLPQNENAGYPELLLFTMGKPSSSYSKSSSASSCRGKAP